MVYLVYLVEGDLSDGPDRLNRPDQMS